MMPIVNRAILRSAPIGEAEGYVPSRRDVTKSASRLPTDARSAMSITLPPPNAAYRPDAPAMLIDKLWVR